MTCRCAMCGAKSCGTNKGRGFYVSLGLGSSEDKVRGPDKVRERKRARAILKRQLIQEA